MWGIVGNDAERTRHGKWGWRNAFAGAASTPGRLRMLRERRRVGSGRPHDGQGAVRTVSRNKHTLEQRNVGGREVQGIDANLRRRKLHADGCQAFRHEFTYFSLIFRRRCHDEPLIVQ